MDPTKKLFVVKNGLDTEFWKVLEGELANAETILLKHVTDAPSAEIAFHNAGRLASVKFCKELPQRMIQVLEAELQAAKEEAEQAAEIRDAVPPTADAEVI